VNRATATLCPNIHLRVSTHLRATSDEVMARSALHQLTAWMAFQRTYAV